MSYSQRDGTNTSLSTLSYLVLYTVVQLSSCPLVPCLCTVPYTYVLDANVNDILISSVCLDISSPYVNLNIILHPYPNVRAPDYPNMLSVGILDCTGARTSGC